MITYLVVHHFGGMRNNPYASTQHLTLQDIDRAHKERWPDFKSEMGYWVGYNFIIFPNYWMQTRLIGEETAAVRGWNTRAISICLAGNFTLLSEKPVDRPTTYQRETLKYLMTSILEKRTIEAGIKVKPGTQWDIPLKNIVPHRHFQLTQCYGNALSDSWAREIAAEYYAQKLSILKQLLSLYMSLLDILSKRSISIGHIGHSIGHKGHKGHSIGHIEHLSDNTCWLEDSRG